MNRDNPRALIRYALVGLALTVALAWAAYRVRAALLPIEISALLAVGPAPLVTSIERQRLSRGVRRPRWAAILIVYLCFLAVLLGLGLLVIPPLVAQARELWSALPEMLQQAQQWLIDRGILSRELSLRGAIAGIGEMIPILGPVLSAVPAIAVAFSVSPTLARGVAVFFFLQQQLENHRSYPR